MKKRFFEILLVLAALASCSKPESELVPVTVSDPEIVADLSVYQSSAKSAVLTAEQFPAKEVLCNVKKYNFIAGQSIDAGDIFVGNDKETLFIEITSKKGFQNVADNVKMWIGSTMSFTDRPDAGHFPFKYKVADGDTVLYLSFTLAELGLKCDAPAFYLVIHGDVLAPSSETAFGGDISGPGNAWWFYLSYTPKCCEPPVVCKINPTNIVTDVKCYGSSTGAIDLTVTDGTAPYAYLWSNGATTEDISGIPAGTYSVTITDANKCVAHVESIIVAQPLTEVKATAVVTNISVFGAKDGAIDLTPTGGIAPYTFLWNTEATTEDISGLEPGTYSVTITDANGCIFNLRELLVSQPDEEKPKGVIAFARKTYEPMVFCFSSLDLDENGTPDFNDLGWTNGPIPLENYTSGYNLYIGITDCGATDAVKVGEMRIASSSDGTAIVTIEMLDGYTLIESHLYIGNDKLPKDTNGDFTTDPKFYTYKHENLNDTSTDTFSVSGLSGDTFVIASAMVNKP